MTVQGLIDSYCELFVGISIGLFVFQITARLKNKIVTQRFIGPFSKGELLKYLVRCFTLPLGFVLAGAISIVTGSDPLGITIGVVFLVLCMVLPAILFDRIDKR